MKTLSTIASPARRRESGVAAVEFALVLPLLLLVLLGIAQFAMLLSDYQSLTSATDQGVRVMSLSRGYATPYTDTVNAIKSASGRLSSDQMTITLKVNNLSGVATECATDTACKALLDAGVGLENSITVSYPASLLFTTSPFGLWGSVGYTLGPLTLRGRVQ